MTGSTVASIASDVAAGTQTARSVIEACLERADDAAHLNAFISIDGEGALAAADRTDDIVRSGHDPGPLAGVPVALKDIVDHAGHDTTCGSSFFRRTATRSATVVQRLESAGAVIMGRAGLHEFAFGFSSENDWFGPVRNPLDPHTSPGGSSGGSAAAVAAGVAPVGIGTDTGGSVRVPAALCGLVGLKVTHGRVPLTGVFPLAASLDTVGPITATVADAAAVYLAMAGPDGADPWSRSVAVTAPSGPADPADLVIGIPHPWTDRPLERGIVDGWRTWLETMAAAGATLVDVDLPAFAPDDFPVAALAEAATVHRRWYEERPDAYGPEVASRLEATTAVTVDEYVAALEWRAALRGAASHAFDGIDVLATPATATLRKVIGEPTVDGGASRPEPYRRALSWFSSLVNQAGLPALVLPMGRDGTPPPSVQLIAPWWQEARLLEIGSAAESETTR